MWFWHQPVPKIRVYFRKLSKHQLRRCKDHSARIWILIFTLNIQVWIWGHFLTWTWTVFRCINSPSNLGLCSLGAPDVLLQFPWVETRSTNGSSRAVCWKSSHFETCKLVWVVFWGPRCGLPSAPGECAGSYSGPVTYLPTSLGRPYETYDEIHGLWNLQSPRWAHWYVEKEGEGEKVPREALSVDWVWQGLPCQNTWACASRKMVCVKSFLVFFLFDIVVFSSILKGCSTAVCRIAASRSLKFWNQISSVMRLMFKGSSLHGRRWKKNGGGLSNLF